MSPHQQPPSPPPARRVTAHDVQEQLAAHISDASDQFRVVHESMGSLKSDVKEVKDELQSVSGRLDHIGLNGDGPAIRAIADATPALLALATIAPKVEQLVDQSELLINMAQHRSDWAAAMRIFKRSGLAKLSAGVIAGSVGVTTWIVGSHVITALLTHLHWLGF